MATDPPDASVAGVPLRRRRRAAHEVHIGVVTIGGRRPIAVQSMTNTRTADAAATADQALALVRVGCDIVRVAVTGRADVEALPEIRRRVRAAGVEAPLAADIHFSPRLALAVVEHVDKIRINPGNFADHRSLVGAAYDEALWERDRQRLFDRFAPLVDRARSLGVALRIGVNHGSLSDRIVQRWGDSPEGVVQSALEFVAIAEDRGHRELVLSLKASNPQVMVRACRLAVRRLEERGFAAYPLHLGVTEAGGGEAGRIKSAAGIGALLADGLGDTIRVSLTEDPVAEPPVARELIRLFAAPDAHKGDLTEVWPIVERRQTLEFVRREAARTLLRGLGWGGSEPPRVEVVLEPGAAAGLRAALAATPAVDLLDFEVGDASQLDAALATLCQAPECGPARGLTLQPGARSGLDDPELRRSLQRSVDRLALIVDPRADELGSVIRAACGVPTLLLARVSADLGEAAPAIAEFARRVAGLAPSLMVGLDLGPAADVLGAYRLLAAALDAAGARAPLVLTDRPPGQREDLLLGRAGRLGALLLDGLGDAIRAGAGDDPASTASWLHGILQGVRRRLERADFIACPSCGRTLFDLETTTERIRQLTRHLRLKIAVMGCIVNGPGEMADADYGYVGWGAGKVALFVGRELVTKDIPSAEAPERLVALIKERGDWVDPRLSSAPDSEQPAKS